MSKKENILDEADQHTGPRTCPECGYQYPFSLFVRRYVLKYGFPKWTCPNCQQFIKYNYTKSNFIGITGSLVYIFIVMGIQSEVDWVIPNSMFLIPYLAIGLILLKRDTFQKYEA